ncbi:hypothetical protein AB0J80_06235 [Actinoplanes sp. NPDC049548]|uniref:hypothetical protein n=1 Tax=Actinoplanes sp. NPDC049548 TaxID=3155152 RepID=UPI0034339480
MKNDAVPVILSETKVARFRPFGQRALPRAGVVLVVKTSRGDVKVIPDQRTLGEYAFAPHATQYEIDVAKHDSRFEFAVKSAAEDYAFQAAVDVTWRVQDPARALQARPADGTDVVRKRLRGRLSELGRRYDVEDVQEFEAAIRKYFSDPRARVLDDWLLIEDVAVEVSLDRAGTEFLRQRRETRRKRRLIEETHETDLLEQEHAGRLAARSKQQEIELERRQREFDLQAKQQEEQWAADLRRREAQWEAEFQARMRRQEDEWKADLKAREERAQLENEQARMKLFLEAMEKGDAAVLAMHLGRHPDDAKEIIQMIVQNQALNEERQAKLLADMIDKDMIIGADLEGLNQELIRSVMGLSARRTGGVFSLSTTIDMSVDALADKAAATIVDKDAGSDD